MGELVAGFERTVLEHFFRDVAAAFNNWYVRLHIGDSSGGANVAANNVRKQIGSGWTFTSDPDGLGSFVTNTNAIEWLNVPASETYTHVSLEVSADGVVFSGVRAWAALDDPVAVVAGDTFRIPAGSLKVRLD